MRKFIIRDYEDRPFETEVDLDNLEDILSMSMEIVSGDEILSVVDSRGEITKYDSCPGGRITGYYDGGYRVYSRADEFSVITEEYLKIKNSYERQRYAFGMYENGKGFKAFADMGIKNVEVME